MYIEQIQLARLKELIEPGKAVLIFGSRRAGKTTLLERLIRDAGSGTLLVSREDITVRSYLESQSIEKLRAFIGDHTLLVVDEAQYVDQVVLNLKLLVDHVPGLRIVATGSSAFGPARDTGAPLAGSILSGCTRSLRWRSARSKSPTRQHRTSRCGCSTAVIRKSSLPRI